MNVNLAQSLIATAKAVDNKNKHPPQVFKVIFKVELFKNYFGVWCPSASLKIGHSEDGRGD
jgi:hypothetical protein